MKYKSEIIKEIVDNRGHEKSSLHYESECVESWIKETKGSYPKLTDYESEWLNYMEENHIGMFPYMTLSDVTNATVENVVPYAYKSAILLGNTLVNALQEPQDFEIYTESTISYYCRGYKTPTLKANTKYYYKVLNMPTNANWLIGDSSDGTKTYFTYGNANNTSGTITLNDNVASSTKLWVRFLNGETSTVDILNKIQIIFIEYQDGMENWDIPYFEGMQSVKMPVLSTIGKNLLKPNRNSITSIHLKKGTTLILSTKNSIPSLGGNAKFYDIDGNPIWMGIDVGSSSKKFTLPCDIYRIENTLVEGDDLEYQLEVGTVATPYEPYKTNILTVNEEVELRGIGDVRDELDLLTREKTERIGEIVLNGSESWALEYNKENTIAFYTKDIPNKSNSTISVSDKFTHRTDSLTSYDFECIKNATGFYININKNRLPTENVDGLKTYLQSNPITVQYQLATESVKTVDLTVVNQDGETLNVIKPIEGTMHLSTSADNIKPTFSGEIPVEAITQNLASFIEE